MNYTEPSKADVMAKGDTRPQWVRHEKARIQRNHEQHSYKPAYKAFNSPFANLKG